MRFVVERREPDALGLDLGALQTWLAEVGPVAVVDLETTGLPDRRSSEILEVGVLLLDPGASTVGVGSSLVRPSRPIPPLVSRLTGIVEADVEGAPRLIALREGIREALAGRLLVAHQAEFERAFLRKEIDTALGSARFLDTQDLLGLTHPDAPDLRLETFVRPLLGREERHRAFEDALDLAEVLGVIARGAIDGESRHAEARRILARHLPTSPWRGLLAGTAPERADVDPLTDTEADALFVVGDDDAVFDFEALAAEGGGARAQARDVEGRFLEIGSSDEGPVPFALDAILAALSDAERGERHFPGYRVREEQLALAREFFHVFEDGGIAKLEGGTGVGKSLAYLAVAIPFAIDRAAAGAKEPVVLSTRTKLLQDQLLRKDIAAAARFLGHASLRALSIKGRANYVCERRLGAALGEASDPALLDDLRTDYALLEACARIRPNGEIGTVPAALLRRHPRLRELLRASVATRSDQCSREQCAHERRCPFGRHRRSLAKAHLVVANHDLLLRWPPDYPAFAHVVMDEGHEVGGVAEEVYAIRVRPEDVAERLDELFGAPVRRGQRRYATTGLVAQPDSKGEESALRQNRRDLMLELIGLGRTLAEGADAFGGVELTAEAARRFRGAAQVAEAAARRLDAIAQHASRTGPAKRLVSGEDRDGLPTGPQRDLDAEEEAERAISAHVEALASAAHGLRVAFAPENDDYVAAFEGLESPYDRWSLVLRPVAPGEAFREEFLQKIEGLAVVSATLFVGDDDHAALGEVGLAGQDVPESWSRVVGSPFPYAASMRVIALEHDPALAGDLVEETAQTLATLARAMRGRTLGLFTSLARMRETADRLSQLLEGEGIEVLLPRRASDDPGALVDRFRKTKGGAVLLGARRFWQGIDVRGEDLQAVVIEKLPFDVPTELRRRRDERLRAVGEDPFRRAALGKMLLHLKQMAGRLIRSETDRGLVVIVDARRDRGYFRRLADAFPEGVSVEAAPRDALPAIVESLDLGL
ncbi:MAG: helicase C-terminal domain-containing protein, partial [Myxococcota bacterium]